MSTAADQLPGPEAIAERIRAKQPEDTWGDEIGQYLPYLRYDLARPYLKEGTTQEEWETSRPPHTREALIERMRDYMPFAFDKANNERGISANCSVMHYIAWTWLAGDTEFSQRIEDMYANEYCYYGKLILRAICEHYGWDWKQWDDGDLTNGGG